MREMILIAENYKQQRDKNDIIRKKNTNQNKYFYVDDYRKSI